MSLNMPRMFSSDFGLSTTTTRLGLFDDADGQLQVVIAAHYEDVFVREKFVSPDLGVA